MEIVENVKIEIVQYPQLKINYRIIMDNLFSNIVLEFNMLYRDIPIFVTKEDVKNIDELIKDMRNYIDKMYKSDGEDIEDFFDLIQIINEITYTVLENKLLNNEHKHNFIFNQEICKKTGK
jgi:hypothetical protein